jgi:hypothetical protein
MRPCNWVSSRLATESTILGKSTFLESSSSFLKSTLLKRVYAFFKEENILAILNCLYIKQKLTLFVGIWPIKYAD